MKKKIIIILIILCALLGSIALYLLTQKETPYAKRLTFTNKQQVLAIAYMGGVGNEYNYDIVSKYYSTMEIDSFTTVDVGGEEMYLVIPRYKGNITVSSLTMAEDGATYNTIVSEVSGPFFLRCNISDIFSNSEINLNVNNKEYTYSPYISLKDGSVVTEDFVLLIE